MQPPAPHVDIVIPVYNAKDLTRRCAESVLRYATGSFRLILVDDASNEPGMREVLVVLGRRERVTVLRNAVNRGFVVTANRGMKEAVGDVLLLNSAYDRHSETAAEEVPGSSAPLDYVASHFCVAGEVGTLTIWREPSVWSSEILRCVTCLHTVSNTRSQMPIQRMQ